MITTSLALFLASLSSSYGSFSDWPQYNGPAHDRASQDSLGDTSWENQPPREVWRVSAETGFSSYCVADGRAFTLERRRGEGRGRESIVALNAATGAELWTLGMCPDEYEGGADRGAEGNDGGDGPRSTPSHADGRVFALDTQLNLVAADAGSGRELWRASLKVEYGGRDLKWGNSASPVLAGGNVIVAGGGPGESMLAFDQETGNVAWSTGDELYTHVTPTIATLHGVEQVLFLVQSGLVSLAVDDGRTLWRAEYPYRVSTASSPVVHGNMVYVSAGYGVGAGTFHVDPAGDGTMEATLLWQKRNDLQNHWSTPLCVNGKLYGLYGFKKYGTAPLACVDMATGELLWEEEGFGPGGLIRVGNELLVLGDAGQLVRVAVDPEGYRELGRIEALEGKCWSSPAFSEGRVYLRSTREGACYDLVSG